jgi:hypothetical protein
MSTEENTPRRRKSQSEEEYQRQVEEFKQGPPIQTEDVRCV